MTAQSGDPEGGKPKRGKRPGGKGARKAKGSRRRKKAVARPRGDMLLAIAHPLRRRILRKLRERDEATSPTQLAGDLKGPLGQIAYHVRVLWRLGAVSAAGEQQVRGAIEHFYRSTIENDPPIEALLEETRKEDEGEE